MQRVSLKEIRLFFRKTLTNNGINTFEGVAVLPKERYQIIEENNAYSIIDTQSELTYNIVVKNLGSIGYAKFYCRIFNRIYKEGFKRVEKTAYELFGHKLNQSAQYKRREEEAMKFEEVKTPPEFTLKLTLKEAVSLWHIVNESQLKGNENATPFVNALYDFAENSNSYNEDFLEG